jgi:hypothetical protein
MASLLAKKLNGYIAKADLKAKAGFFPSAKYPASMGGEYVAEIAFKNEYGSPLERIPPRPFFRPAVADNKHKWSEIVRLTLKRGGTIEDALETVGLQMQGDIRDAMDAVTTPELSAYTIQMRQERGNNDTKPLNDTGYMRSQITHAVDSK